MTEKERFQRAFAPLHASPDTMTEVLKMTERKTKRPALRRAATIGLAESAAVPFCLPLPVQHRRHYLP